MPVISPRNKIKARPLGQKNTKKKKGGKSKCMWHGENEDVRRDGRMRVGERQSGKVNI